MEYSSRMIGNSSAVMQLAEQPDKSKKADIDNNPVFQDMHARYATQKVHFLQLPRKDMAADVLQKPDVNIQSSMQDYWSKTADICNDDR